MAPELHPPPAKMELFLWSGNKKVLVFIYCSNLVQKQHLKNSGAKCCNAGSTHNGV